MRVIADLHVHSKYSRACSGELDLEHNVVWAEKKGITIVGTGDFTHPAWFAELQEKLVEDQPGLFKLKSSSSAVRFMLTTEVSCIYKQGDSVRRIHICLMAPSFVAVATIIAELEKRNVNLKSDGRPIMGLHAPELCQIVFGADPTCMVIPAHIWTPWFALFGSKSGFDRIEDCFGDYTSQIFALETGLSSDPVMNWQLSVLDRFTLVSNSDAHSSKNLGREANAFEIPESEISYAEIRRILKEKDFSRFAYTIEFFPEEGKYHFDGHADCAFSCSPTETKKLQGRCPRCHKNLILGTMYRVEQLADRLHDRQKLSTVTPRIPFKSIIPLPEIIAAVIGVKAGSKKVAVVFEQMLSQLGNEFSILLDLPLESVAAASNPMIAAAIGNMRSGHVNITPGYDGVYGVVNPLSTDAAKKLKSQTSLF